MPFRETLLNLAITAVVVLIVVLVGILLKESRRPVAAVPVSVAQIPRMEAASGDAARPAAAEFEILHRPQLVESRANEADTVRVLVKGAEHIFVLYFVDALEATMNHPQLVARQGRYFNNAPDKVVTDTGAEAAAYVTDLLKSKPFNVITRWEPVLNTTRFYALITVELEPGKPVYLADLLMLRGYAWLAGTATDADASARLPADVRDIKSYVNELQKLKDQARSSQAGIWGKVARK